MVSAFSAPSCFAAEMAVLFFDSYVKDDFHSRKELKYFDDERIFQIKNRNIKLYEKDKKFSLKKYRHKVRIRKHHQNRAYKRK